MNDGPNATWLPNLVGGVSIWKLAVDLNEPKFFDGRLLVPETEGSESLPVTVRWELTGLEPLHEARAKYPSDVELALADFKSALDRVAKVFATPNSGFDKYKAAFTVPAVDADDGGNYFYSARTKKLFVINWGASPRSMAGRAEYVFGYEDWGKAFKGNANEAALAAGGSVSALATPGGGGAAGAASDAAAATKKDDEKDEKKEGGKKRPWWMWPLFALAAVVLVLLALLLLKSCDDKALVAGDDAGEAGVAADAGDGAADAESGAAPADDAGGDAAEADGGDAGAAEADGRDAGQDAASVDGGDAGGDAATASNDDDDDDDDTGGGGGGGAGAGAGGGKVIVTLGGAGGGGGPAAKTGPHRRHYQAEAVKWRIASGNEKVSRTEARGKRFDVWLGPGRTFQGVGVDWQDKSGKWHAH
jgi:hypothetical protein